MIITPDTNIRLLKCPLELDNKNQITFENLEAQYNYFSSLEYIELEGATYQRKDSSIYYPEVFDNLYSYNYVMYQNNNYGSKWFYAFITDIEYKNDNCTRIGIATDTFQTWQFDLDYKASYVEREMIDIASDTPGANLVPEGLESGEYKIGASASIADLVAYPVVAYTKDTIKIMGTTYDITRLGSSYYLPVNGIETCLFYLVATNSTAWNNLVYSLQNYDNQSEFVAATFTVPKLATTGITHQLYDFSTTDPADLGGIFALYDNTTPATPTTKTLTSTPSSLDGYTPKNNKVRQYPYMYIGFNPPNGTSKIYRYEDFTGGTPSFKLISEVNPNPSVYVIPQNYRGVSGDS